MPFFLVRKSAKFIVFFVFSTSLNASENNLSKPFLQVSSDEEFSTLADQYFDAGLYDRAIFLYQQAIQTMRLEGSLQPEKTVFIRNRLAESYFLNGNYDAVISLLKNEEMDSRGTYFIALSYSKTGDYPKAAQFLERYLLNLNEHEKSFGDEPLYELGRVYFLWGRFADANDIFTKLNKNSPQDRLRLLSAFYLARIALSEENCEKTEYILNGLQANVQSDDTLRFELAYLQGEAAFQKQDYLKSVEFFSKALPTHFPEQTAWYQETLYHLGWSYLKLGNDPLKCAEDQKGYFEKAEIVLKTLLDKASDQRSLIALGQCYLARSSILKEEAAYLQAESLFARQDILITPEGHNQALLLLAEAAPAYEKRDILYRHLTQETNLGTSFYPKGWYLRGLNDLEYGKKLLSEGKYDDAHKGFERAVIALKKAVSLLMPIDKIDASKALKNEIQALFWLDNTKDYLQGLALSNQLVQDNELLLMLDDPDEIYYMKALIEIQLADNEKDEQYLTSAEETLKTGLQRFPKGRFADKQMIALATLYYNHKQYSQAENMFMSLVDLFPLSPLAGESLFWAARCADERNDVAKSKDYRTAIFEKYPDCEYAPEAYFSFYSYRDYLQGDRAAIKHLQSLKDKYPKSPFVIHAYYLIGLDFKRDRKTPAGKWIRKKNFTAAIDAFQEAESTFDSLYKEGLLQKADLDYLTMIRYRAVLERALANLAISDESEGAKRQIYLEYAEEVLRQIVSNCRNLDHPLRHHISNVSTHAQLEEESCYWLAQACMKSNKDASADKLLDEMLDKYRSAKITRGYFLSRAWYDKAMIAMRSKNFNSALQFLQFAEDAAKGNMLNTDEKLDLWIQQSICYQNLNDFDNGILILSKVVNDNSISSLRVKAMFLRAEAYELQGRRELARKQLEATAKKGGQWALKAKEKLEQHYEYQ